MSEPESLPPVDGGCLCGTIRYRARPESRKGYYCHCRMCQLACGNTRATFINLRQDALAWTAGQPTWFASSKIAQRAFCGRCGTSLGFRYFDSDRMDLSVGSLDDPAAFKPTSHFATESRLPAWDPDDGLPGQRLDEYDKITGRWKAAYGDQVVPGVDTARSP